MPTYARARAGRIAQKVGGQFEIILASRARSAGIECIRIPDGCKMVRGSKGYSLKRVPTPFDYVMLYNNKTIVLDAKTVEGKSFTYSSIITHQLQSLSRCEHHVHRSGYIVWHRDIDALAFYSATLLRNLRPRDSLNIKDGIDLGSLSKSNLARLFEQISPRPIDSQHTSADIISHG